MICFLVVHKIAPGLSGEENNGCANDEGNMATCENILQRPSANRKCYAAG